MGLVQAGRGGGLAPDVRLSEDTGADILRAVALSGRGYWGDTHGPVLRYAGPLAGELSWRLGEDTRMQVVLDAERPGLELIPATPPWYLDPETGECGPLETGLGDREAGVLAMAPVIPAEVAEALEAAARARLKGLALPLPPRPERRRVSSEKPVPCLLLQSEDLGRFAQGYWAAPREPAWSDSAVLRFEYGGAAVDPGTRPGW
jgi:hypothetical protein